MRIALIGRTALLAKIGRESIRRGHVVAAIVTAKETAETTGDRETIREFAEECNAKLLVGPRLTPFREALLSLGPIDIGLSVNYVSVVTDQEIAMFNLGVLNAHGGDLPRYRGNACQAWAILNSETSVALCIHKMEGGRLDSGPIIRRDRFSLSEDTYIGDIYDWMSLVTPHLMVDAAEQLGVDPTFFLEIQSAEPQNSLRTFPRRPEDGKIKWSCNADEVCRLVRASSRPFSGAFATYEGRVIRIWRANVVATTPICSVPGQIVEISDQYFDVSAANGTEVVRVSECSFDDGSSWQSELKSIRARLT